MDKNGFFPPRERDVRLARQFAIMRPISKAKSMQSFPQQKLGTGVARSDASHDITPLLRRHVVGHIRKFVFEMQYATFCAPLFGPRNPKGGTLNVTAV